MSTARKRTLISNEHVRQMLGASLEQHFKGANSKRSEAAKCSTTNENSTIAMYRPKTGDASATSIMMKALVAR